MSTIRQQRVVRPNIGEVSSKANTLSRQLSHLWPINADDGNSAPTRMRMPFAMRDLGTDGFSKIIDTGISYRPQASVGSIKYYAFQTDTNWVLTSEDLPDSVDTTISSENDIFLQSTGDTLMVYGYDGTKYRSFSFQGGVYTEVSSTALAVSDAAFTSLNSGKILGVGGDNLYSMAATGALIDSFPLQLNLQPVIESIGSQAIVSLDNGGIEFYLVDGSGIVDSFSGGRTADYVGSTPTQGGVAFWYTVGGDYDFYLVSEEGIEYTFTIAAATLAAELVGTEKEVVYVMLYDSADKSIGEDNLSVRFVIREVSANQNGKYKLEEFTIESEAPATVFDRKLIMNSDAAIYANPTLGCADEFTLNSSSPVYAGSTFILDTSYYPASILKPMSGGGGGGQAEADTLQTVTDRGATTTNNVVVNGLTATTDPVDAQGDLRARSNVRFDLYGPVAGHNLLIVGTDGTLFTRSENYYTTEGWVNSQGFATQTWVNQQNFATQSFVTSQGYVDENLSSLSFNVANGVLTASLSGGTQTTVDLDGRYLQSLSLNDLTDVDGASNKNDGAVMQWSAVLNRFVLSNTLDLRIEGSDLLADNIPTAGQVYQYNGTTFQWATVTSGGVTSLNDIGDVSVASPNTNDVLTWNGSTWIASASGGGGTDGVVTSTSFIGGVLTLNRSNGLPALTQTLDGRYLQSYTETDPTGVSSIAFSGTNTKTLTITRNNGTTVQASFTDLQGSGGGGGSADGVVNGGSYNNGTGALTLTRTESLSDVIIQMGGGFMTNFFVAGDTTASGGLTISNGNTLSIKGDTNGGIYTRAGFSLDTVRVGIEDQGVTTVKIANEAVTEAKLDIANAPSDGQVLTYDAGDMVWVTPSGGGGSADGVVSNATFNTSNGILSLSRTQGLPAVTVDLDGRYKRTAEFTFIGDVSNGAADNLIESGETFAIKGVGGIATSHGLNANELLVTIPLNSIQEDRLNIANTPSDGQVLSYDSGDMVWTPPPASVRGAESSSNTPSAVFTPSATLWSKVAGWGSVTSFGTSFVSQASNTFTVSEAGVYEVSVSVFWDSSASSGTTYIQTGISVNNVNPVQSKRRGFSAPTTATSEWVDVKGTFNLSANDTITIVHLGDANSGSAKVREAHINFNKLQ